MGSSRKSLERLLYNNICKKIYREKIFNRLLSQDGINYDVFEDLTALQGLLFTELACTLIDELEGGDAEDIDTI